jgi:spore coat protein U-like protein
MTGGALVSATGNGADQTFTIYGRVPAQTTPAPGTYTDTVTVTVTY